VIEDLGLGGAEKLLATLLPLLAERGVECELAILGRRDAYASELTAAGVRLYQLGLPSRRQAMRAVRSLHRVMRHTTFSLVHTHLAHANLYGRIAAGTAGLPVTTTYHDTDYDPEVFLDNPSLQRWKVALYRAVDRATVRRCARVVAVSSCVARSLQHRLALPTGRIEIIPNGIPASAVGYRDRTASARVRAELSIPTSTPMIVHVGRLTPQKGQLHTLALARELQDQDVVFVLVGDGPSRELLERKVAGSGLERRVRLVGGQADVMRYLHAADIFLLPSLHEGFGIAAVEAMASGLPVVAYRHGPLAEIILDGHTGILVEFGSIPGLATAVRALLANPQLRAQMGEAGRQRALSDYQLQSVADRHVTFYDDLILPRLQRSVVLSLFSI
jgi:glycosyltransferase involved in cell wall biosynthesis